MSMIQKQLTKQEMSNFLNLTSICLLLLLKDMSSKPSSKVAVFAIPAEANIQFMEVKVQTSLRWETGTDMLISALVRQCMRLKTFPSCAVLLMSLHASGALAVEDLIRER